MSEGLEDAFAETRVSPPLRAGRAGTRRNYGVVVLSVKVSVLL